MPVTTTQSPATGIVQRGRMTLSGNYLVVVDCDEAYVEEVGEGHRRTIELTGMIETILNDYDISCHGVARSFGLVDDTSSAARKLVEKHTRDLQARLLEKGATRDETWVMKEIDRWLNYNMHNQKEWQEESGKLVPPLVQLKVTVEVERLSETKSLELWAQQRKHDQRVTDEWTK